jgi:hypothetical protein
MFETLASSTTAMGATQAAEQAVPGFGFSNEAFSKSESVLETRRNTWSCLADEAASQLRRSSSKRRWRSSTTAMGATQAAEQAVPGFGFSNEAFSKHIQTLQRRNTWSCLADEAASQLRRSSSKRRWRFSNSWPRLSASIQADVIPVIADATSAAVNKQLNGAVSQQLGGLGLAWLTRQHPSCDVHRRSDDGGSRTHGQDSC